METDPDLLLAQIAIKNGLLKQADVDDAVRAQKEERAKGVDRPLGQVLVERGRIREEDLRLLSAGQEYYRERHEARRICDLAVAHGLATRAQVEDALARQKAGFDAGRGLIQPIGSILVTMGVLRGSDVHSLQIAAAKQPPPPAARAVHDTRVDLAVGPAAPARQARGKPAPSERSGPRGGRRVLATVLGVILLAALVPAGWLLFRELVSRQREALVERFEADVASAEQAADPEAAEAAWERALRSRDAALKHATRYGWDAAFLRADAERAARALARLRESRAGVERIREAREAARREEKDAKKACETAQELVERIRQFEASAAMDDPWRKTVAVWKEQARATLAKAEERLSAATALERVNEMYEEAEALYRGLEERVKSTSAASVREAEIERSRALCQYFLGAADADDRERVVETWLRELAVWEKEKARIAAEEALAAARRDPYERAKAAYELTRKVVRTSSPWAVRAIIEETLQTLVAFQEGAAPDDARLGEVAAWRVEIEGWKAQAEAEAARIAEERETRPQPPSKGPSEEARERIRATAVYVKAGRINDQAARAIGSGFVVGERGYVVTSRRVIAAMDWFTVGWDASKSFEDEVPATLVAWSRNVDLAVLKLPAGDYQALPLSSDAPRLMREVLAAGFPAIGAVGFHPALTIELGRVTSERRDNGMDRGLFEMDAKVAPGASGGPVLDAASATAIGVIAPGVGDRAWAIPVAFLRREFPPLFNGQGYAKRVEAPVENPQGRIECETCKGQRPLCKRCDGKGGETLDCPDCGGHGFTEHFRAGTEGPGTKRIPCKFCQKGKVFYACPACGGTGRVPCSSCEIAPK